MASSIPVKMSLNTFQQHCLCFPPKPCGNRECAYSWRLAGLRVSCFNQTVRAEIFMASEEEYTSVDDAISAAIDDGICGNSLMQIVLRHRCSEFNGCNHIISVCKRNNGTCMSYLEDEANSNNDSDEGIEDEGVEDQENSKNVAEEEEANPIDHENKEEEANPNDHENKEEDKPDAKKRKML